MGLAEELANGAVIDDARLGHSGLRRLGPRGHVEARHAVDDLCHVGGLSAGRDQQVREQRFLPGS